MRLPLDEMTCSRAILAAGNRLCQNAAYQFSSFISSSRQGAKAQRMSRRGIGRRSMGLTFGDALGLALGATFLAVSRRGKNTVG
jgi:hypothetical protein